MMSNEDLQANAKLVHDSLRNFYEAWEDLQAMAQKRGYRLDEKTAELKLKN